jgi:hypothetical protein
MSGWDANGLLGRLIEKDYLEREGGSYTYLA